MTKKELKSMKGSRVYWDDLLDPNRKTFITRSGVLESLERAKNIIISGQFYWYPDLANLRLTEKGLWN